jgi:hypothetical protein
MQRLYALSCVFGWSSFWAFSYLALSADPSQTLQTTASSVVAFAGFLIGMVSYLRLGRDIGI